LKQNRSIFLPAISVAILSILLILYSYYSAAHAVHPSPPHGGGQPPGGKGGTNSFLTLGTIAIVCGAINFSWFLLKRKLTSSSRPIKKLAKIFYAVHTYTGLLSLGLIVIHGSYYLITKLQDTLNIFSGLAAFLLILALAMYGWRMRKKPNNTMRKTHFLLSNVWLLALIVHAGGTFIQIVAVTLMIWAIIWVVEIATKQTVIQEEVKNRTTAR
jgi:hypothetical protein